MNGLDLFPQSIHFTLLSPLILFDPLHLACVWSFNIDIILTFLHSSSLICRTKQIYPHSVVSSRDGD